MDPSIRWGDGEDIGCRRFAFVLAGAEARLEHDLELNPVRDRFPKGLGGDDAR